MLSKTLLCLSLCSLAACATTLTPAGKSVQLMKADPPAGCSEVASISGEGTAADDLDSAKNDVRNKAAAMGANYVRMESFSNGNMVKGTAYKCPSPPP